MSIVYLRMKKSVELPPKYKEVTLKNIAHISTDSSYKEELDNIIIYHITKKDKNIVVIDSFLIIDYLNQKFPKLEMQVIGPAQCIIRIHERKKTLSFLLVAMVWLVLFIGTAMTIMNFHYDVSMQEVQQKLHFLLTGKESEYPLWIQVPYSIGLGIGMLLFFNHWFSKKFNEEPSPLEIEINNYQQDLDNYLIQNENMLDDERNNR
ncbi:stage V sporulation protein AA [Virgibacillus sp. SK37]|uniref:stage V sporulation protein AA n=1 Tax=Virgibacillus sp. SK37 TaxID=403957 RepID=UPI0004D0E213|nr:stage V sporulation protein AA [Virgibacillus sp. SK37]AIF43521.1 stage V sporulation protein AA [Virgibacillus sp. SK37]